MNLKCPHCSEKVSFDVSQLGMVLLKFQCPSCGSKLTYQNEADGLVELDKQHRLSTLRDLVQMALADNSLSEEEVEVLKAKAKKSGIRTEQLREMIQEQKQSLIVANAAAEVEYEDVRNRYFDSKTRFYDINQMAAFICSIGDCGVLRNYRDDFVEMAEANAESWKSAARRWDRYFDTCDDPVEYDELLENRNRAMDFASHDRALAEEVRYMSRNEFLDYCHRAAAAVESSDDDW